MSELLPCPICGRKATVNSWWSESEECGMAGVGCSRESYTNGYECARILVMRSDEKTARNDAIRLWNTRAERTCQRIIEHDWLWTCSECGSKHDSGHLYNYCPNCGAKVVGA